MSNYPDYPDNRLIVNNVDLSTNFQLVLLDGYVLSPPEPKLYTVDIPGGNGVIDLTESLTGDTLYSNRKQSFTFSLIDPVDFEDVKTALSNFLHGKSYDYVITMDPDYTYHGRFTVSSYNHASYGDGILGTIQIDIDADPYKMKPLVTYNLNAAGGKMYHFVSGRKPVRPIIETFQSTIIVWNNKVIELGKGTFRLNDVLFREGVNDLYINTLQIYDTIWDDLGTNGKNKMTWTQASQYRWDELQRLNVKENAIQMTWSDLSDFTWDDLTNERKLWRDLDYKPDSSDSRAFIQYEWGDL